MNEVPKTPTDYIRLAKKAAEEGGLSPEQMAPIHDTIIDNATARPSTPPQKTPPMPNPVPKPEPTPKPKKLMQEPEPIIGPAQRRYAGQTWVAGQDRTTKDPNKD